MFWTPTVSDVCRRKSNPTVTRLGDKILTTMNLLISTSCTVQPSGLDSQNVWQIVPQLYRRYVTKMIGGSGHLFILPITSCRPLIPSIYAILPSYTAVLSARHFRDGGLDTTGKRRLQRAWNPWIIISLTHLIQRFEVVFSSQKMCLLSFLSCHYSVVERQRPPGRRKTVEKWYTSSRTKVNKWPGSDRERSGASDCGR